MNKDFVTVPNASGNNNGSFDVICEQNSGNERSTILTVSGGGGINKTANIIQYASLRGSIEIAGGLYSNGTLVAIGRFGMNTDIRIIMNSPEVGLLVFPIPIQEMSMLYKSQSSFLQIISYEEIPSYYKGDRVVAFLDSDGGNRIYTPKKELTVDVYRRRNQYVFELHIADGITIGNTEIININSALNNKRDIAILLTSDKIIYFKNFIWKAVHHES